ncbi:hypothetical protein Slin15195_G100800 [Septoria linicola]|uniref:Uncharacterized protein n=1 Tax=Septoria linicola TaxID=215465 RepID=A0A9Q9EMF5_9PEZI|nr:hypothetical protein Slin14017_G063820 [Septoria linicola]USW56761.1 hypothetical protein Slin15195_G100800 [Septoria linicola]
MLTRSINIHFQPGKTILQLIDQGDRSTPLTKSPRTAYMPAIDESQGSGEALLLIQNT